MRRETCGACSRRRARQRCSACWPTSAPRVGLNVTIGAEHPSTGEWEASLITAPFRTGETTLGTIGVVGPTRMDYLSAMASVRAVAEAVVGAGDGARSIDGHRPRSVRGPRHHARRVRRRHQEGLPASGARAAPRRERRCRSRGAVQGGRRRLRDPVRSRQAAAVRRVRHDGGPAAAGFTDIQDIFDMFFGQGGFGVGSRRRGSRSRTQHGEDLGVRILLGFRDAVFGARRDLEIERLVACDRCQGNGAEPGTAPVACRSCGGSGRCRPCVGASSARS